MLYIEKTLDLALFTINNFLKNEAATIVVFTLLTRIIFLPLSIKQMRFAKLSKKIQPEVEKAKKDFEGDNLKITNEISKIYKKYNVNPIIGIFSLMAQLFLMYFVFKALRDSKFITQDGKFINWKLTEQDNTYILPAISALLLAFSNRNTLVTDGKRNDMQNIIMSSIMFFLSIKWHVSSHVYFITSLLIGMVQDYFISIYISKKNSNL